MKLYCFSDHIIVMCSTQVCNTDIQYSTKEEKKVQVAWGIGGGGVGKVGDRSRASDSVFYTNRHSLSKGQHE